MVNPPGYPWAERNVASAERVVEWEQLWKAWRQTDVGEEVAAGEAEAGGGRSSCGCGTAIELRRLFNNCWLIFLERLRRLLEI